MKAKLLKLMRAIGRPLKAQGCSHGQTYLITIEGKKKTGYLQLFVFRKGG